jgi:ABC-type lipoprotein release transport system permease subunit
MQIFTTDYHENKTINNSFVLSDTLREQINHIANITSFSPRTEYFALASSDEVTKGAIIVGIDPELENKVTNLKKWVIEGEYLQENDRGVLLASDLADYLNIQVGDTLVLYGQGFHGVMAADIFPVRGIMHFALPAMNSQFIYMGLQACQELFSAEDRITSLVLMVNDYHNMPQAMKQIKKVVKDPLMIQSWDEMQPELVQMIEADKASGLVTKSILYIIITFGIFGTVLMMISERSRELGVMISIGMQRTKLAVILFIETVFIGVLGTLFGILGSIPLVAYFVQNPIVMTGNAGEAMTKMGIEPLMYFSFAPFVFYNQALTVFVISVIISIYPVYKAFTIKINLALRA